MSSIFREIFGIFAVFQNFYLLKLRFLVAPSAMFNEPLGLRDVVTFIVFISRFLKMYFIICNILSVGFS